MSAKTEALNRYNALAKAMMLAAGRLESEMHIAASWGDVEYIGRLFQHIRDGGAVYLSCRTEDGTYAIACS